MTAGASLTAPSTVRALLRRHALTPSKGFGQNFLVDAAVLRATIDAAAVSPADTVLEVGPGLGALTAALAARAGRVVSVELDRRLLPVLAETLAPYRNVELVAGDALAFDLDALPPGSLLVANLPYNVATPLIARALESGRFARLVFLVQREVADRLRAAPGSSAYGALSLLVRHFGEARVVRQVRPGAFLPPPKVSSSVVRITVRGDARPAPALFSFIHRGFAHRRKTLHNNLVRAGFAVGAVQGAMREMTLDPRVRAEALDLDAFRELFERLRPADDPADARGGILPQAKTDS